ncbi:hypothetical protein HDV03_003936 [Kappamyces sp. JEL0829]|nr:hypothetical protein HDV03_003936 [Kappamyces sp. JEL0829]
MPRVQLVPNQLVPFSPAELSAEIIHTIVTLVGVAAELLVIVASLRNRNFQSGHGATVLVLSLCVADLLFSMVCTYFGVVDIWAGGWSSGQLGCIIDAVLMLFLCCTSILFLLSVTMERYLVIIKRRQVTIETQQQWIAAICVFSLVVTTLPLYTNSYEYSLNLEEAKFVCVATWYGSDPYSLTLTVLTLITIFLCVAAMVVAYTSIVLVYFRAHQRRRSAAKTTIHDASKAAAVETGYFDIFHISNISEAERRLFFKAVSISGSFMCCWCPYTLMILYEVSTQKVVSPQWSAFFNIMASTNSTLNALLLITFDPLIQFSILELLPKRTRSHPTIPVAAAQPPRPKPTHLQMEVLRSDSPTKILPVGIDSV